MEIPSLCKAFGVLLLDEDGNIALLGVWVCIRIGTIV